MNKRVFKIAIIALSILIFPLFAHALDDRTDTSGGPAGEKSDHAISVSRKNAYNLWKTISDLRDQQRRTMERFLNSSKSRRDGRYQDTDSVDGGSYSQRSSNTVKVNPNPTLPSQNNQTAAFDSQALDGFEESCINSCKDQVRECVNEAEPDVFGDRDFEDCREIWSHCYPYCLKEDASCEYKAQRSCEPEWFIPCPYEYNDNKRDRCVAEGYEGYKGGWGRYNDCVNKNIQDCYFRSDSAKTTERVLKEGR